VSNHTLGARPRSAFVTSVWSSTVLLLKALFRTRLGALLPLVLVLLLLSLLIALTGIIAPIAPFIYPLF
jgi:hypothetical protein